MENPILILTGPEEGPFLKAKLQNHASDAIIDVVHEKLDLQQAAERKLYLEAPHPRLIAFCTDVIVAAGILDVFKGEAYNFHPGSPDYPGANAASFAIYDEVENYGVTAHKMLESIDSGAIVGTELFAVPADCRFMDLEILAYQNLLNLFDRLAPQLVVTDQPLQPIDVRWGEKKRTRQDFERMKIVTGDMSETEIRLRWRAFG